MGKYVDQNLGRNESIVEEAKLSPVSLVLSWIVGVVFCWLLLIPTIKAIIRTIAFFNTELAFTNKRVIGKTGIINTKAMDAPLNKIQSVSVSSGLFGKVFGYGNVNIHTAAGEYHYDYIRRPDDFKGRLMAQMDIFDEERVRSQAAEMASAISGAVRGE